MLYLLVLIGVEMKRTFTIHYNKKPLTFQILAQVRQDGRYYEINIPELPRFYMKWGATDKYELVAIESKPTISEDLLLLVSDTIEEYFGLP